MKRHALLRRMLPGLVLGTLAASSLTACADKGETLPPIRVVRIGHGDLAGLRDGIERSVQACQIAKDMAPTPVKLPADITL